MTPGKVYMFAEHRPAAIATIAILALALVAILVLSRIIKRREAARAAAAELAARPAIEAERLQRTTRSTMPQDVQERLRYLTAGIDRSLGNTPLNGSGKGKGTAHAQERPESAVPRAGTGVPDEAIHHFGDAAHLATHDDARANASSRHGDLGDDATTFFGHDLESDVDGDATRFFGDVDAGDFFSDAPQPATAPGEQDDATRFFGADDADDDTNAALLSSQSQFFSRDELGHGGDVSALPGDGYTGLLDALPPVARASLEDGHAGGAADSGATVTGTGSSQVPPPVQGGLGTSVLDRVRARLAAAAAPEVIALSVLDSAGRVLAGETDDDLTGELRSLMAESGQGHAADLEQPVRLGDDSNGALLLLPTGANALLGALVRDAGDPQATRARLRLLAHDIGDAMQRAS